MNEAANQYLLGCNVLACATICAFFIRFWRKTRDRLFAFFAVAFCLLGTNWLALAFRPQEDEVRTVLYVLRLLAFILILYAIFDKNRPRKRAEPQGFEPVARER